MRLIYKNLYKSIYNYYKNYKDKIHIFTIIILILS